MDALKFAEELKRMCSFYVGHCERCPLTNELGHVECMSIKIVDETVPIVEKWAKEHPTVRNVDYVAEGLEKLGYEVNKEYLIKCCCPPKMSEHFTHYSSSCGEKCSDCRKWWLEQYEGFWVSEGEENE